MNGLHFILFTGWILLSGILYYRWLEKNKISINRYLLMSGFFLKIILGCFYGYLFQHYYGGDDTWLYHQQSITETKNILEKPWEFIQSLFLRGNLERYEMNSTWKEIEYTLFIKILAIFNIVSGGHYYMNVILLSSITILAPIFFVIFFTKINPKRSTIYQWLFFLFPPLVFWTSGIRREGLIFLSLGICLYQFQRWITLKKLNHLIYFLLFLFLLGIFRYSIAIMLLPMIFFWWIFSSPKQRWNPWLFTSIVSLFFASVFFLTKWIGPINLPQKMVEQQQSFKELKGGSYLEIDNIEDNPISFVKAFPSAIDHVLFRPYPFEKGNLLTVFSTIETWFVLLSICTLMIFGINIQNLSFSVPFLFYILLNYLIIGYTIPFLGAIVRYRVIFEALLLAWVISQSNFKNKDFFSRK